MELFITLSIGVLGAICASLVGVIAERAYTGQSWKRGRSRCNSCRENLSALDLLPVLSWVMSRGACRHCAARIPVLYTLIEGGMGLLFALSYLTLGAGIPLVVFLIALLLLLFIVLYDLRHTIVPLPAAYGLIVVAALFAMLTSPTLSVLATYVLIATCISGCFYLLYALSSGRAMGLGDTPIAFALSLLVGPHAIAGVMFSFWIGAVIGIAVLAVRRGGPRMGIEVPFVPFLAAGYLLAYYTQWNPLPYPLV